MDGVQIDAPDAAERMDDHLDAADAAARAAAALKLPEASALRVAALGARGLTAMATGDASAAADALDGVAALRRDEDVASVRAPRTGRTAPPSPPRSKRPRTGSRSRAFESRRVRRR